MRTYKLYAMLLTWTLLGCSKSDQSEGTEIDTGTGVDVNYTMILSHDGQWSGSHFNANLQIISLNSDGSSFNTTEEPQLVYRDGSTFSLFNKKTECTGEITTYNFSDGESKTTPVFDDLGICNLQPIALALSNTELYVAYGLWNEVSLRNDYYIRLIDRTTAEVQDIPLDKEPLQLVFSNNRLFAFCLDADETGENSLVVVDTKTQQQIHEIGLGLEAQKIAKDSDGNILVSYATLYAIVDSSTLKTISVIRYSEGKEPKFESMVEGVFYDGKLYYKRPKESVGDIPNIPAVYDFSKKLSTWYYYENFLTTEELQFEYGIGDTSMVAYDAKNNLILIGYRKTGSGQKGGLLRIKPAPEPKFIDNTDLDGIPYAVFVN